MTENTGDIDEDPPRKPVTFMGRNIEEIPCFRSSLMTGILSGLGIGIGTFFLTKTGEDCDDRCIDDAFRVLSSLFLAAVPAEVSADDFVEADCNVQAVASLADEDIVAAVAEIQDAQAESSSGNEDRPDEAAATRAYSAAEVEAAFGLIRRCCGDMEGTRLLHLDSLDKIEASVFNFISKTKKQAMISDFFFT
ncbi:hypothetical protein HPB52_015814 [Rhipicephalus sanguineus]|uniref:Uncharacterized protein n=1 Tax=Rhipicephalus sanguineus TaxID=34632 RepID=A0A9D4PFS9_RHISA|nr:hypothetical protein HPB52_015814 [Rhipicephalus sanguineus]